MATKMHRLQISLPHRQARFLERRARLDGVSMAEVVRRLIERESGGADDDGGVDSVWDIAGIAEDREPRIGGVPVSENPELYLTGGRKSAAGKRASGGRKRRS